MMDDIYNALGIEEPVTEEQKDWRELYSIMNKIKKQRIKAFEKSLKNAICKITKEEK
jgi:predicted protein tyrosine phosphatase